jgi:hypothetical protein
MPDALPPGARPPGQGPFDREISLRAIVVFSATLAGVIVITGVLMWVLFRALESQERARESQPSPRVADEGVPLPPEPHLQTRPEQELAALRAAEEELLHSYGWVDESAGIAHIPIERSIELLVQSGLPTRVEPRAWIPPSIWRNPSLQRLNATEEP